MTVSRRCDQVTRTPEGTLLRCAATMVPALALSPTLISARKLWNTRDGAKAATGQPDFLVEGGMIDRDR